jgi:hypothetical protein
VNPPRIIDDGSAMDQLLTSNLTFCVFVFLLCRRTSGAFTNDSSTPTLRINLTVHPIRCTIKEMRVYVSINFNFTFLLF